MSFDLVFGHAVLHHIPDLDRAFAEFRRVLRPGGVLAFCGEPSRYGDRIAVVPKRLGVLAAPAWRRAVGASAARRPRRALRPPPRVGGRRACLRAAELRAMRRGGFDDVRIRGEELLANAYGWLAAHARGERRARPGPGALAQLRLPQLHGAAAHRHGVLEPRLPPQLFYNLVLSARRPS